MVQNRLTLIITAPFFCRGSYDTRSLFQIITDHAENGSGERAGDDAIAEAFVIYRPTGQILWALVDGMGQDSINLTNGYAVFDLLA